MVRWRLGAQWSHQSSSPLMLSSWSDFDTTSLKSEEIIPSRENPMNVNFCSPFLFSNRGFQEISREIIMFYDLASAQQTMRGVFIFGKAGFLAVFNGSARSVYFGSQQTRVQEKSSIWSFSEHVRSVIRLVHPANSGHRKTFASNSLESDQSHWSVALARDQLLLGCHK